MEDNIFDEITADLRRDRLSQAWDKYGRYIIGTAVGIVLVIALSIAFSSYQQNQGEQASARYGSLLSELEGVDATAQIVRLLSFAATENNGYGALARMSATLLQARKGERDNALAGFDALADDSDLPDSLRDFARLQAAIVLLDSDANLDEIESRLQRLLRVGNGLQPMAREVLALAYIANDKPLEARSELIKLRDDAATGGLTRERVGIMLTSLRGQLSSPQPKQAADATTESNEAAE